MCVYMCVVLPEPRGFRGLRRHEIRIRIVGPAILTSPSNGSPLPRRASSPCKSLSYSPDRPAVISSSSCRSLWKLRAASKAPSYTHAGIVSVLGGSSSGWPSKRLPLLWRMLQIASEWSTRLYDEPFFAKSPNYPNRAERLHNEENLRRFFLRELLRCCRYHCVFLIDPGQVGPAWDPRFLVFGPKWQLSTAGTKSWASHSFFAEAVTKWRSAQK